MTQTVRSPDFARPVRQSFDDQPFMRLLGAELARVEPGGRALATIMALEGFGQE